MFVQCHDIILLKKQFFLLINMYVIYMQHPDEERAEQREPLDFEEESEEDEECESEDEETPLIKYQKKPNQFLKALMAFWPFGEAFRELSIFNKIIEIIKVSYLQSCKSRLVLLL